MSKASRLLGKIAAPSSKREYDCDKHKHVVTVYYFQEDDPQRRAELIAALVLVIAEYTDGWCAIRHAKTADIEGPGMRLHFRTPLKAVLFRLRVGRCLHPDIVAARLVLN